MVTKRLSHLCGLRRPPRVALFSGNYNYTVDGANKSLNRLVGHLEQAAGAQVRVYSPTAPTPAFPPVGDLISAPSIPIPMRPDYRLALGLTPRVRQDVQAFRPDIIHLSAPDLLGGAALRFARSQGIPVVASLHTLFDSYLDYYRLGWLRPVVRRQLMRFYSACDYVLAPTWAIADEMRLEALPARLRVWARGVDAELFSPARRSEAWRRAHGFAPDDAVVVFLGRIVMEKGLAVFADTVRQLDAGGRRVRVLVIGDGPARAWFETQLPGATFTGFLSGEALATAVASGDIFFNPSATETFGNVNLEAMAARLAPVCADVPNTRALLRDGETAFLCPSADPAGYAAAIRRLADDPAARTRMAQAAHDASASYRWSEILETVVDVYAEALTSTAAQAPAAAAANDDALASRAS